MRNRFFLAALGIASAAGSAAHAASPGAWTTFVRAGEFTALTADSSQVWGATAEAGLVHFDRATQSLSTLRREPGAIASNHLTALARDRSGRLWVGTLESGVSRRSADGRRWEVMNLLDGLPSDSIRVLEANGDTVWIGTTRGFSLWNGRQVSGSLPDGLTLSFDTTFSTPSVTGIALQRDTLWIATRRGIGLARISQQLSDWRPVNGGLVDLDIRALAFDGADLFAHVGTNVYRWRADSSSWSLEPGPGAVHRLADAHGAVLAAGESGVFRWVHTATDSSWVAIPGAPIPSAAQREDPEVTMDENGDVFATLGEALFAWDGAWTAYPLPAGPPGNELRQVAVDRGSVYATTGGDGIGRYDGQWRYWPPVFCSGAGCDTSFIHPKFVNGFFVDRSGRKWAASWSQAIDTFRDDGPIPSFNHPVVVVDALTQRRTWWGTATQDASGNVWLGMDTEDKGGIEPLGVELYDSTGAYIRNFNSTLNGMSGNLVHALATTRNGRVWAGYDEGGVDFVAPPDTTFIHLKETTAQVVRGMASYGDSLWLVTSSEVWRFPETASVISKPTERIPLPSGPPQLGFQDIAVGNDGTVWVGTSAGIHHVGSGVILETFDVTNSPLPDDEVRGVAVDRASGAVWMTTASGLARYDPGYVPPPPAPLPSLHARVFPNPALLTGLGVQLRIQGDGESYTGEVYDISGRKVRRLRGASNGGFVWDGKNDDGALVSPGIYFLRVEAQGRSTVARVVLLH